MIDKYRLDDLRLESGEKGELARWVIQLQKDLDSERRKAGNYPVIGIDLAAGPDRTVEVRYFAPTGYVMVPKVVTPEIGNAINEVGQRCTCGNCSQRLWDLLLASAPVQVDIEMLASTLKNAPLAPSDNQGRPRAPVVPPAIEPDYKVIKSILPTANPDEYACCIADDMWNACRAAMLQGVEPVSQTYKLPELIEGMEVSIDVSTCDADAGNRYFGTVNEVSELDSAKNGYILLVQDAKPNFDVNGNSPVIPEGSFSGLVNSARALLDVLYEFGADEVAISEYVTNLEDALRVAAAPQQ